jgi:acetate---CoA ligase (ADP-forming)
MAGADRLYDALFASLGVTRAERFSDLLDLSAAFASARRLTGKRIAILTSTGGAGALVTDNLGLLGFETPPPDAATAKRLAQLQSGEHAVYDRNPIDVTLAGLQPAVLQGAIQAVLDSERYDALITIVGSSGVAQPELMANAVAACLPSSSKPIIAYVSPHAPDAARRLNQMGVPAFNTPESCATALLALLPKTQLSFNAVAPLSNSPLASGSHDEHAAKAVFTQAGIPCPREIVVTSAATAMQAAIELGGAVALKLLSQSITHKSEAGGVAVNLNADTIAARFTQMQADVLQHTGQAATRFLVQQMVSGGLEIILGVHRDRIGTAILLGMGGVTAELFNDSALVLLPKRHGQLQALTLATAHHLINRLKTAVLLQGYRGRPIADIDALAQAIVDFSTWVAQIGERLLTAEINPLFVLPKGQGVLAADGVLVIS